MHTFNRNPWIACLILFSAAAGSISAARPEPQAPPRGAAQAITEEERRKILEKLLQDMQKTSPAQPPQNPAAPAQTPAGIPAVAKSAPIAANQIQLNFDGLDLVSFINTVGDSLGISPILIDPDVKGSVTIHSAPGTSVSRQDAFPIFNIILKNNNAALVKTGGIYQIVPISQGLKQGLEVVMDLPPVPPAKPAPDKDATKKQEAIPAGPVKPPAAGTQPVEAKTATTPPPGAAAAEQPPTKAPAQAQAAQQAVPPSQARPAPPEVPRLATHVIRVEFVPVATLIEPVRLFMTDGGVIMPYERLNMLILTDYTDSIQKILDIIRLLDSSYLEAEFIDLVEIKFNAAADVLDDLKKVFGGGKDSATGIYMISLDRINTIMLMANSKRALEEVKRWIVRLDSTTGRSVQTYIYTVENSTAANIAMVLSLLFGGGDMSTSGTTQQGTTGGAGMLGTSGGATGGRSTGGITPAGTSGTQRSLSQGAGMSQGSFSGGTGGTQMGMGSGTYGLGAGMGGQVGGPRLNQGAGMSAQWLNGGAFVGLQGMVRLVADDINNALIIQASSADYNYLLDTIKRMDVLPRQVIIDARIFEIDLTDDLSFGVSASLQARSSGDHLTTGSLVSATGALSAASFAFIGNAREILMNLDALRQKTKVRILEAPSVLALDGTAARINVGGSVPVQTQGLVTQTGLAALGTTYRDTGTSLMITPRISASGTVTLQIYQEVSSAGAGATPTFSQTVVETTLAVKDGESVAIAGLIRESDGNSRNGIPFLSEIPILGSLFGRTTRSARRSELLIMITPHVIRTPERFREMTEEIKDSLRSVRKYVDEKQKQIMEDQEKARKERFQQEEKQIKKEEASKPVKKEEKPIIKEDPQPPIKKEGNPTADFQPLTSCRF